jgi:hypothetical protein
MFPWSPLLVAFSLASLPVSHVPDRVRPDLASPPTTPVPIDYRIECGPWAARACCQIVLQKGDSLLSIAKDRLGSADRAAELLAVNPTWNAEKAKPGDVIWLPPKAAPKDGEERLFAFGVAAEGNACLPLAENYSIANGPRDFQIMLVPQSSLAAFQATFAEKPKKGASARETMAERGAIEVFPLPFSFAPPQGVEDLFKRHVGLVDQGSAAVRAVVTLTLARETTGGKKAAAKNAIQVTKEEFFDKSGQQTSPYGPRKSLYDRCFFLLLAALGGGGLLALRKLRIRPRPTVAMA